MGWFIDNWNELGGTVGKAALMYVVAMVGLRIGDRRTFAQWAMNDFITVVAIGSVVGRTAIAGDQSFVTGAIALITLIFVHHLVNYLRFRPKFHKVFDHPVRVLVEDGRLRLDQLRGSGLTDEDVFAQLRVRGVYDIAELKFLLYESAGGLTIIRRDVNSSAPLLQVALTRAADYPS